MEILKDSEIVEVRNDSDVLKFTCLQRDEGVAVEVKWSKGEYDPNLQQIIPTEEKTEQVNNWCKQYFDLDLMTINKATGKKIDVYVYDTFSSFWESDSKFKLEDIGTKFETTIEEIELTNDAIVIRYKWNGEKYHTLYRFTKRLGDEYFVFPQKKRRQLKRFEETFGLPIERKDELVGLPVSIEVKNAFNKHAYGELSIA